MTYVAYMIKEKKILVSFEIWNGSFEIWKFCFYILGIDGFW